MKKRQKSHEMSNNVLEEKRKIVKRKICIKNTFIIIAMNFVQEQLVNREFKVEFKISHEKVTREVKSEET